MMERKTFFMLADKAGDNDVEAMKILVSEMTRWLNDPDNDYERRQEIRENISYWKDRARKLGYTI